MKNTKTQTIREEKADWRKHPTLLACFPIKKFSLAIIVYFTCNKNLILPSAIVMIKYKDNEFIEAKTVIDSCLQVNVRTAEIANRLRLRKIKTFVSVCVLNNIHINLNHKIKVYISNKEQFPQTTGIFNFTKDYENYSSCIDTK